MSKKSYVFMSFRNPDINKNLGVCIVEATALPQAQEIAWSKGINPGGEIFSYVLNEEQFKAQGLELDHLYTKEEIEALGFDKVKVKKNG